MRGPTSNLGSDRFDLISDSNASSMFAGNLPAFSVDRLLSVGISEYEIMIEVCLQCGCYSGSGGSPGGGSFDR